MSITNLNRTNYFKVKDEDKFRALMAKCVSDKPIEIKELRLDGKEPRFCFCCEGCIDGLKTPDVSCNAFTCENCAKYAECDTECDLNIFELELAKIIAPDDAVILTTLSFEGLGTLHAEADIITAKEIRNIDLNALSIETGRDMLGKDWNTQNFG